VNKLNLLIFLMIVLLGLSCKKEKPISTASDNTLKGVVQKGPFIIGSSITVYEMLPSLAQTGRTFNAEILDNRGSFQIPDLVLISPFASLRADGFYYNEVTGSQSQAQITLYCLSDLSNKTHVNVNLLSHLEKSRIEYLYAQGSTFYDAKSQAEREVLNVFGIHKNNMPESELLDITQSGDNNAILLAISLILQGYRTEGELTELLANISNDLRTDGVLNNISSGTALINDAKYLKLHLSEIRHNISTRWNTLGITDTIPNFETYINQFIDSTNYPFTNYIIYPDSGIYGLNMLNNTDSIYINHQNYSFSAILPKGSSLTIKYNFNGIGYFPDLVDGWFFNQDNLGYMSFTALKKAL